MLELFCWIKKYWIRTYLLIASIIGILLQIIGANKKITSIIQIGYLITHTIIVKYLYNNECKEFIRNYDEIFNKYKNKLDTTIKKD